MNALKTKVSLNYFSSNKYIYIYIYNAISSVILKDLPNDTKLNFMPNTSFLRVNRRQLWENNTWRIIIESLLSSLKIKKG